MSESPKPTAPSDRALAERVQLDGDERAFRLLYRRHTPGIFQLVLRIMQGNQPDAEDVVQEAWIKAVEGLAQFRWESSLRTWVSGIAVNLCRAKFRHRDRHWLAVREESALAATTYGHDTRIDLEVALSRLPAGYRTVVVLHDVEGRTHAEIGGLLGISANTSKSQLFRGRRMLRRLLAPSGLEDVKL